jgi:hypothetical protein
VQKDEALGFGRQQLGGAALERVGGGVGCMQAGGQHQVGLADRLFRPGGEFGVGGEEDIVVAPLQRVEGARRLGAVRARAGRERGGGVGRSQQQSVAVRLEDGFKLAQEGFRRG